MRIGRSNHHKKTHLVPDNSLAFTTRLRRKRHVKTRRGAIDGKHRYTEIATGLKLPTAMTFGRDGNLYVSTWGFGPPPVGMGTIVKVTVPED